MLISCFDLLEAFYLSCAAAPDPVLTACCHVQMFCLTGFWLHVRMAVCFCLVFYRACAVILATPGLCAACAGQSMGQSLLRHDVCGTAALLVCF